MIIINKITVTEPVELKDEQARLNLKKLLATILEVSEVNVIMRFDNETGEKKPFRDGL